MPDLPIFNGDLGSSLMGVMRFPDDLSKAEAYASWRLAGNARSWRAAGNPVDVDWLISVAEKSAGFAPLYRETQEAETGASAVAAMV
jgi:hypothetical protein